MPIKLNASQDGETVTVSGFGEVKNDEYVEFHKELFKSPEHNARVRRILFDWADVERAKVKSDSILDGSIMFVNAFSQLNEKGRLAIIAVQDFIYGLARMCVVYKESAGWEIAIFRERTEAQEWLFRDLENTL